MSRRTNLFLILGIACLIRDISPRMICTYLNGDITLTTVKWNTSMSSREFQESYCPLRCFNGTLVSIHNLDSKCPRLNCFDCSCKRPECEHYGICCPDISVPYHHLPGVENTLTYHYLHGVRSTTPYQELSGVGSTTPYYDISGEGSTTPYHDPSGDWSTTPYHDTSGVGSTTPYHDLSGVGSTTPYHDLSGEGSTTPYHDTSGEWSTTPYHDISGVRSTTPYHDISGEWRTSAPYDRNINKLGCAEIPFVKTFLYITSCPPDFAGHLDTIRLCEEDVPTSEVTIDDFALVVDDHTNVVYRNVHCATCNGAVKPYQVPLNLSCPDFMAMYDTTDPNEILRLALDPKSACKVKRDLPSDVLTFACDPNLFNTRVVSSCDVSHPARENDADVTKACAELNETYHRVFSRYTKKYYKNIFCAICDMNSYPMYGAGDTCRCFPGYSPVWGPAFSMLINLGQSSDAETSTGKSTRMDEMSTCSKAEWPSPDGGCLRLKCSPGKILANGSCRSAIAEMKGLKYIIRLWVRPKFRQSESGGNFVSVNWTLSDIRNNLREKVQTIMVKISDDYNIKSACLHESQNDRHANSSINEPKIICWLGGDIVARDTMSRDEFEFQVIKDLLAGPIDTETGQEQIISYSSLVTKDVFKDCREDGVRDGLTCEMDPPLNRWDIKSFFETNRRPLNITGLLDCPYVSFGPSYYNITIDKFELIPSVTLTVYLNGTTLTISDWADLNMLEVDEGDILNICHQVLDSRLQQMVRYMLVYLPEVTNEKDPIKFAQYVTTLVCLTCSMICLVLSLVTYLRFPVLQTSAGQNNVCLCLSLLLAQAALIAASHRPRPIGLCKAVGLLTHFLWLWMFSWTFICSFHMFRVFTANTRNTACSERDGRKKLIKRIVCSLMCPVIIVMSVVVGSLISSDGETIGYGLDACYLDSVLLIGVAMVAPLTAVLVCNMIFFAVTVCKIHHTRRLQRSACLKRDDLNHIFVCVKLSSITGACWAAAIIAEAVGVDVLRFISIFMNGFQGVFIFLSYICNKRVLNLYVTRTAALTNSRSETNSIVAERCLPCVQWKAQSLQMTQSTDIG